MNDTSAGQPILENTNISLLNPPTLYEIELLIFEIARRYPMTNDEIISRAETIAKHFHERGNMLQAEVDKFKADLMARGKFKDKSTVHPRGESISCQATSVITRMIDKRDW